MKVYNEGNIYYFPGFEPGGPKSQFAPQSTTSLKEEAPEEMVETFRREGEKRFGPVETL